MTTRKTLVLCVDRDNDIGRKTRIGGPIIGRKANLHAATELALKDPTDSDVNALFHAIKTYDGMKKRENVEIATLTGDIEKGAKSDRKIIKQLERVLRGFPANDAVFISDGEDDEYIIPVLRSKIRIIYPHKVIVKQNAKLEGAYYVMYDFFKSLESNPKLARLIFGIPALALLIYAVFGPAAWRLILGVVGLFFFIKGFQLESYVHGWADELKNSIHYKRLSFLLYLVAGAVSIIGAFIGYNAVILSVIDSIFYSIVKFVNSTVFIFALAALIGGIGKAYSHKMKAVVFIYYLVLLGMSALIAFSVTQYLLTPSIGYMNITYSVGASIVALILLRFVEGRR